MANEIVVDQVGKVLAVMEAEVTKALPPGLGLTWERLERTFKTVIKGNPDLLECTPVSLQKCMMQSAELGLEPPPSP